MVMAHQQDVNDAATCGRRLVWRAPVSAAEARRGIQSVEVAFRLLTALQASPRPMPLKEVASRAGMTPSAANNYLVSLVRTGLAAADEKPGHYRLGPASVALGMRAIQQMDGFEVMRREVTALRDITRHSAAVTVWTQDGPVSLFKQEGDRRAAYELRTGLLPIMSTAAGKAFAACLPQHVTMPLIEREAAAARVAGMTAAAFVEAAREEMRREGFVVVRRHDGTGYVSAAAPAWDWGGTMRFALSIIDSESALATESGSAHMAALLGCASAGTAALGGISGGPAQQADGR
jgi:DNA-binding IclR family transcriptional regulator